MTEEPMEEILWKSLSPEALKPIIDKFPHAIGEIVDNYERFGKYVISARYVILPDLVVVPSHPRHRSLSYHILDLMGFFCHCSLDHGSLALIWCTKLLQLVLGSHCLVTL
jgi:hypothetical protein